MSTISDFSVAKNYPFEPRASIFYRIYGENWLQNEKIPVTFLHGLMGYATNWGKIWPEIAEERAVITFDQRGHGRSEKPNFGYSPVYYALDLWSLLDEIRVKKIHLVGHSMGGRVAMYFAAMYPDYVASLVLEDSGAFARPSAFAWINNLLDSIPTPFSSKQEAKKFFDEHFKKDPLVGTFLHSNITKVEDKYDWRFCRSGIIETIETGRCISARKLYESISCPILIVRGEDSIEFPEDEAAEMESLNQNAKLVTVTDAGHFVHVNQPKVFTQLIQNFIKSVS